jgi:formylglycine-generating enzyme required for sulfatase activity
VRLPTEAEWEYACRAGTKTRWSFGDQAWKAQDGAWTAENSAWQTHPVGGTKPNDWGLYDMTGNAWEWCRDWVAPYTGELKDPAGPPSGDRRCLRGGSWSDDLANARSAFRHQSPPTSQALHNGFRICAR